MEKKLDAKTAEKIDRALDTQANSMKKFWPIWSKILLPILKIFDKDTYDKIMDDIDDWNAAPAQYQMICEAIKENKDKIYCKN